MRTFSHQSIQSITCTTQQCKYGLKTYLVNSLRDVTENLETPTLSMRLSLVLILFHFLVAESYHTIRINNRVSSSSLKMSASAEPVLTIVTPEEVKTLHQNPVDEKAKEQAAAILKEVNDGGLDGLLNVAVRLRDLETKTSKAFYGRDDLKAAYDALGEENRALLQRTANRIRTFAESQRKAIVNVSVDIPGGKAGHDVAPVKSAGCYAPGGRYPLPSSVLMTAVTARAAGVEHVWVASPRPVAETLAAAYLADADGLMAIGGAQAIGALAYGVPEHNIPGSDVIVGPGNKWVTAAKSLVSGKVQIDMLAGPSEVLVIADSTCDPGTVASDLLAQAEHDTEARPILVCTAAQVAADANTELAKQLASLPTRDVAREAVKKGFACVCPDIATAVRISDEIGPEHLEIITEDAEGVKAMCNSYGGVFVGSVSAEVFGDYGAGPNHVLPTCGTSRYTGGLSVFTFLRIRTWMNITKGDSAACQEMIKDAIALGRIEGLEGHARAAEARLSGQNKKARIN